MSDVGREFMPPLPPVMAAYVSVPAGLRTGAELATQSSMTLPEQTDTPYVEKARKVLLSVVRSEPFAP